MPVDNVTNRKTTLILLSWGRLRNIKRIINAYVKFPRIDEIILWNNNPKYTLEIRHPKIKYFQSKNYFTISRYAATFFSRNEDILFQDDDLLLTEDQIERLYEAHLTYPDSIVGCFGRNLVNGKYVKIYSYGKVDLVLGRVMLFNKSLIGNFARACPPYDGALEDDILFCLSQPRKPVAIYLGPIQELPRTSALSKRTYHMDRRQEMVRYCLVRQGKRMKS